MKIISWLALACVIGLSTPAFAGTIATQTTPAGALAMFSDPSQVTFDDATPGTPTTYTEDGVTFTPNAGAVLYIDDAYIGTYNTFGVNSLHNNYSDDSFGALNISFAAPVSGFGFFFGASDNEWVLTAFNGSAVVGSQTIEPTNGSNAGDFFGITGAGITSATLVGPSTDYVLVDDLTYGGTSVSAAPEPGTWALMLGGLAMIGGMLRIAKARRLENKVAGVATA